MHLHDPGSVSTAGMATAQGPAAAVKITRLYHANNDSQAPLLAQIPDLSEDDPESLIEEHITPSGRQFISQSLASKLVLGGGVLLVLAAILPFMFAKNLDPKPAAAELSTWHPAVPAPTADTAPAWNVPAGTNATASAGNSAAPPSVVVPAMPAGPGGSNFAPPSLTGSGTDSLASRGAAGWGNDPPVPTLPAKMPPLDASSPSNRTGDSRAMPPTVQSNRPMALGDRSTVPTAGGYTPAARNAQFYQADTRSDNRRDYRSNYPPMADLKNELSPQGPRANQPPPAPQGQSQQPSGAEFQGGIIATPPNRN